MNYNRLLIIIALLLPACWPSHKAPDVIIESHSFADIYTYITPNDYNRATLLVLDIDNTILRPITHLGSDQWFYAMVAKKESEGLSHFEAVNATLPLWFIIQESVDIIPVESITPSIIADLQKRGVTVIALTARSLTVAHRTVQQLQSIGINLSSNLPHECPIKYGDDQPALYIDGIIFVGNHDKGEVLAYWLSQINYTPKKVIFVDDKLKNIHSVEKAINKCGYPFIGLRYGYLDEYIKTIDINQVEKEYKSFIHKHHNHPSISHPIPHGAA